MRWIAIVLTQTVETGQKAKLTDFISVTSVSLTIVAAILAYASIAIQAKRANIEERGKLYADSVAATKVQIQAVVDQQSKIVRSDPLRLDYPIDGTEQDRRLHLSAMGLFGTQRAHELSGGNRSFVGSGQ